MKRASLLDAGLGAALRESQGPCKNRHSVYLHKGDRFCRECGMKLKAYRNCPTCGKLFMTKETFVFHILIHAKTNKPRCPVCKSENKTGIRRIPAKHNVWRCYNCLTFLTRYMRLRRFPTFKVLSTDRTKELQERPKSANELYPEFALGSE